MDHSELTMDVSQVEKLSMRSRPEDDVTLFAENVNHNPAAEGIEDTEPLHVEIEENGNKSNISENEQLQQRLQMLENVNKKLIEANTKWESYCKMVENGYQTQVTSLREEIELYQNREKERDQCLNGIMKDKDEKLLGQKQKVINLGQKVDSLIKELKEEKLKNQLQQEENEKLNVQINEIKNAMAIGNYPGHVTNKTDTIPMQTEKLTENNDETTNESVQLQVLKQQVMIFKEDFDQERKDREKVQLELCRFKNVYGGLVSELKAVQESIKMKDRDIEVLMTGRNQDRNRIEKTENDIQRLTAGQNELQAQVHSLQRMYNYQQLPLYAYASSEASDTYIFPVQAARSHDGNIDEMKYRSRNSNDSINDWTCKMCTYTNEAHVRKCAICNYTYTEQWTCKRCTYSNDAQVARCGMCGNPGNLQDRDKVAQSA